MLSSFLRRILGPESYPLVRNSVERVETKAYQPEVTDRVGDRPIKVETPKPKPVPRRKSS